MSTYTAITDAEIDVDSPVTQILLTKYRENLTATVQRASGAPKILGVPYNRQVFTASGTWTKPSNAEAGDTVIVWGVGGGGSGAKGLSGEGAGGGGGAGFLYRIDDISTIAATMSVTIGAGAATNSGIAGAGDAGGNTLFGTSGAAGYCRFTGGQAGAVGTGGAEQNTVQFYSTHVGANTDASWSEGLGDPASDASSAGYTGSSSHWGGGGGGRNINSDGGFSSNAGHGGAGSNSSNGGSGAFPGGGGGASVSSNGDGGAGGAGYMVVYSIKEG